MAQELREKSGRWKWATAVDRALTLSQISVAATESLWIHDGKL